MAERLAATERSSGAVRDPHCAAKLACDAIMFPPAFKNATFIARHGSWNRTKKIGGDIVVVKLNEDGTFKSMEPFLTGFIQDNNYVGRPADVLVSKDGSLLVSDDYNGAVYRISYD
jgi:glucose/arabinose dehydrogenase